MRSIENSCPRIVALLALFLLLEPRLTLTIRFIESEYYVLSKSSANVSLRLSGLRPLEYLVCWPDLDKLSEHKERGAVTYPSCLVHVVRNHDKSIVLCKF